MFNGTNCEVPDKVPSVFMINGSIIFAVQTLGTVLMKKKEVSEPIAERKIGVYAQICCKVNEFYHEEDYPNEVSLKTDNLACPDVNPRDLIHYRGFYILWLLQLIECFPAMTFLSVYKFMSTLQSIGFAAIKERLFVRIVGESSAAFLLVGFILWSFLADKVSYKVSQKRPFLIKTPLLSVALCWTIGLAIFPQCLKLQLIKFFYAMLVFISVLCIAGYRILVFVTVAKAFGVKYLNYNFACVNTASVGKIFGGVSYTLFAIYFPILEKIDAVLYICAALNALVYFQCIPFKMLVSKQPLGILFIPALLLLVFLPDTKHVCTCFKSVTHVKDEET
uniref:Uncharacterized protein n=1 Tax=Echinococcus canadensis TaxID=519352 RepID=A0A915F0N4_9CEST